VLVAKYFVFVGNLLFALLFLVDWFLPDPPVIFPNRPQIDMTIRIASARKWPERIVFDTSQPTIVTQAADVVSAAQPVPSAPGETPSVSEPLTSTKLESLERSIVSHLLPPEAKRKVGGRIPSRSSHAIGLARLKMRGSCCWSERANRLATSKPTASSRPRDWF
jgi:hypothetical protein